MSEISRSDLDSWEKMVRTGKASDVAVILSALSKGDIPPPLFEKIANLAWRTGCPQVGIKILFNDIRINQNLREHPNPGMVAEYAGCLIELGAIGEARILLKQVEKKNHRADFFLAMIALKEWDYETASAKLEAYSATVKDSYERHVVTINLLATYVYLTKYEKALKLLAEIKAELSKGKLTQLLGNCLEIESQIHIGRDEFAEAASCLTEAESLLATSKNMGWLYCKKWRFYVKLKQSEKPQELGSEFLSLRKHALGLKGWETLRDLDFLWAMTTKNKYLFHRVYFGSPADNYRQRILKSAKTHFSSLKFDQEFIWNSQADYSQVKNKFELDSLLSDKGIPGFLPKKLLRVLFLDFYSPFRVGHLFSLLFPEDYFDFESSPGRVFQLLQRVRLGLKDLDVPVELDTSTGGYRLKSSEGCGIQIAYNEKQKLPDDKLEIDLGDLKAKFLDKLFSASEVGKKLNKSQRTVNRMIKQLLEDGNLVSEGKARSTKYRFVD